MTDIAKRLKSEAQALFNSGDQLHSAGYHARTVSHEYMDRMARMMGEAADEIERLQLLLRQLGYHVPK